MKGMKIISGIAILFIFLIACTPKSKLNVLNFFFDGVPESNSNSSTQTDSLLVAEDTASADSVLSASRLKYFFHEPYQKKECTSCHDKSSVGDLLSTEPDLCYTCHDNFNEKFNSLHGPVDAGFCSACHHPHMSRNKNLLLEPGNNLCFPCHVASEVERPKAHVDIGDSLCISCHDPHGIMKPTINRKAIPVGR